LAALQTEHRPFLWLVTEVQENAGERQRPLVVDMHSKSDVAAANHVTESGVDHPLQYAATPNARSLIRCRLWELTNDGDVSHRNPLDGAGHVLDKTNTNRVQFVSCEEAT